MAEKQPDNLFGVIERNIRIRTKAMGMTLAELSKQIEMTEAGFYKMLATDSIKVKTLKKISEVLQIPLPAFLNNQLAEAGNSYQMAGDNLQLAEPSVSYSNEGDILKKQIKQLKSQLKDKEKIIELLTKKTEGKN
ncbi:MULTISPECIES: helix-turn-helix domain-containing protein [unclassified Mucilaginibacter]|uniref:helix-turn-helix domain-containing protein n=1 Tax=unclassified Mucilaginibacter TaxID=2617802 RepID=UPI0031F6CDDB